MKTSYIFAATVLALATVASIPASATPIALGGTGTRGAHMLSRQSASGSFYHRHRTYRTYR